MSSFWQSRRIFASTTAPLTGSDASSAFSISPTFIFQSTLPSRGATIRHPLAFSQPLQFQSTLPSRGATISVHRIIPDLGISIHAPLTGSDINRQDLSRWIGRFQSTLPSWGATCTPWSTPSASGISIHAPLTGSDGQGRWCRASGSHFNPRSPHGERRGQGYGADHRGHFNPRSPHGERPMRLSATLPAKIKFQSTLPSRGATVTGKLSVSFETEFQSTLPSRGATASQL